MKKYWAYVTRKDNIDAMRFFVVLNVLLVLIGASTITSAVLSCLLCALVLNPALDYMWARWKNRSKL